MVSLEDIQLIMENNLKTVIKRLDTIDASINGLSVRLKTVEEEVKSIKDKVNDNTEGINANNFSINDNKSEINKLKENIKNMEDKLDDQIDGNMQETLVVHGIEGNDKSWYETKELLCDVLSKLSKNKLDLNHIHRSIVRAHMGGKNNKSIYVKFSNQSMMEEIKELRFNNKGIYINQLHSPGISMKIKEAVMYKREIKQKEKDWKIFINGKVQVLVKKPGERKYTMIKKF